MLKVEVLLLTAKKAPLLRAYERLFGKPRDVAFSTRTRRYADARGSLGMASGYIPNYASPLEDAINREQAAGLPISQIRINQNSSLRGAGNPMGLAVTNMRDEPTGAIPRGAGGYMPNFMTQTSADPETMQHVAGTPQN